MFQPRLSFPRPFQLSLACFRVARSPSNSWASCCSWLANVLFGWQNLFLLLARRGSWFCWVLFVFLLCDGGIASGTGVMSPENILVITPCTCAWLTSHTTGIMEIGEETIWTLHGQMCVHRYCLLPGCFHHGLSDVQRWKQIRYRFTQSRDWSILYRNGFVIGVTQCRHVVYYLCPMIQSIIFVRATPFRVFDFEQASNWQTEVTWPVLDL